MNSFALAGAALEPVCKNSFTRPALNLCGSKTRRGQAVFAFLVLLILLFALGPQAAASEAYLDLGADGSLFSGPVLKIIYAAESRGEVRPCFY